MKTNKWRLALLVWSAMFPFSTLLNYGLAQFEAAAHWPLVTRTFCLTSLIVPYMVFGVFPFLNRHFTPWLQRGSKAAPAAELAPPAGPATTRTAATETTNGDDTRPDALPVWNGVTT